MQRRTFLGAATALVATRGWAADMMGLRALMQASEATLGARIGLAVLDTGTMRSFAWRGNERFPMCSTFKALLAAAVLKRVEQGRERLDRALPVREADLLGHAPFCKTRVGGTATVGELAGAAVTVSDNSAANLLLATLGGPEGLTASLRGFGDRLTRLDRTEPTLNESIPGDPRDTTTPSAMLGTLQRLLIGNALAAESRRQLIDWMLACETGATKLRARLPKDWRIAEKTGSGARGSDCDVAMLLPPGGRAPILVASYITATERPAAETNAVHVKVGALVAGGAA